MLTDQELRCVEDEEQKRIAEGQFRAEVRAKLQRTGVAPASSPQQEWRTILFTVVGWSLAGWLLIAAVWWLGSGEKLSKAMNSFSAQKSPQVK